MAVTTGSHTNSLMPPSPPSQCNRAFGLRSALPTLGGGCLTEARPGVQLPNAHPFLLSLRGWWHEFGGGSDRDPPVRMVTVTRLRTRFERKKASNALEPGEHRMKACWEVAWVSTRPLPDR